ncbi:MAG: TlpA family protein disulfide reductase [Bacteroidota bacterium]
MPINKKYFNSFVLIFAIVGALILALSTIWFSQNQQDEFRSSILENDSLATRQVSLNRMDSGNIQLGDYSGTTILLFWNTWVEAALDAGVQLKEFTENSDQDVRLLVAPMHTPDDSVASHWPSGNQRIRIIDGNQLFKDLHVPGVPATIWIDSTGTVFYAQVGYLKMPDQIATQE